MSYNVSRVITIRNTLSMYRKDIKRLYRDYEKELPERNFLAFLRDALSRSEEGDVIPVAQLAIAKFDWSGTWSANAYKEVLFDLLKHTQGSGEFVFVWEGGDHLSGLRVHNGIAVECDVHFSLVEKVAK